MIRIRFHGRGGHGTKTASRIVGTAAFMAGFQVQDSPIYGAERRGAPIAAFTRIDEEPILERGVIEHPDLIIVADESLIEDPLAGVLTGQDAASVIFVNSDSADRARERATITPELISFNLTEYSLRVLGQATALSAGLGAAAAKLSGVISEAQIVDATRDELSGLGFSEEWIEQNLDIVRELFETLPSVPIKRQDGDSTVDIASVMYDGATRGTPSILHVGNAGLRHTGNWRVVRPEIDDDACTDCDLCFVHCPDSAITLDKEGHPSIDYDHCKGCMICRELCPPHAIGTKREVSAW